MSGYPCSQCNMDEGSPVCLQDDRCPRKKPKDREMSELGPLPEPDIELDEEIKGALREVGAEWLMDADDEYGQPRAIRHLVEAVRERCYALGVAAERGAVPSPELVRAAVLRIKRLHSETSPPNLPADSFIERAVIDILAMKSTT